MGAIGVALTVATIAALLLNGGLNIVAIFFLGRHPEQRRVIVPRVLTLGLIATALGSLGVLAAAPSVATAIAPFPFPLAITTAALAGGILAFELTTAVLLGLGKRGSYISTATLEAFAVLPLAIVALSLVAAPEAYVGATAGSYLVATLLALVLIHRELGSLRPAFDLSFTGAALRLGLRGQAGNVLQFLNLRLDILLVPILVSLPAAGVYLVAVRVSEMVTQVASATATFLFPRVAEQSDSTATAPTEEATRITLLVVAILGLVVIIVAGPLLGVAFGPEFATGTGALQLTMLAMIPLSIMRILAGDLKGRGRPGLVSVSALAALIATITGNLTLIPAFGIEGAALASVIAYTAGAGVMLLAYRSVTRTSLRRLIPTAHDIVRLIRGTRIVARDMVAR